MQINVIKGMRFCAYRKIYDCGPIKKKEDQRNINTEIKCSRYLPTTFVLIFQSKICGATPAQVQYKQKSTDIRKGVKHLLLEYPIIAHL